MSRPKRKQLIAELEAARGGRRVVAYVTGDRLPNLAAQIATDILPLFYETLSKIGQRDELDLFLYSTGGITMAAWGLINLLREFTKQLAVLIPFRALSTATLIALGADQIVMGRLGQLSPVDPTIVSPFNPQAPQIVGAPPSFLPVSVEDVRGFIDLARDEAGLKNEEVLGEVFRQLATDVRPLALGSVNRAKEQIKILTEKLLLSHSQDSDEARVKGIIETLTRKLFSHDYLIGRREAKSILSNQVADAAENVEGAMWNLYSAYAEDLELAKPYNPDTMLGSSNTKVVTLQRAFLESTDCGYLFKTVREVKRVQVKQQGIPVSAIQERVLEETWTPESS